MRLPNLGTILGTDDEEWREVPVYAGIKRVAGTWVQEGFNIDAEGAEKIPDEGGVILACNHASWFDPVFLGAVVDRPVRWMAKAELFRHPVTDFIFQKAGQIKVDRVSGGNQAAVDRSVELAREERVVGIFPEGSRSLDGSLRRGRTGVARVALRAQCPVVPVAMNSYDVLPKHAKMPFLDDPLVVEVGEPVSYDGGPKAASDREICRKITDDIMAEIGRLLEVARTRRERLVLSQGV